MSIVKTILEYSKYADQFNPRRNKYSVLASTTSELGELATEVAISSGDSYKAPGEDGVVGEAVDVIVSAVDMIYVTNPNLTEEQLEEIVVAKLEKWIKKIRE